MMSSLRPLIGAVCLAASIAAPALRAEPFQFSEEAKIRQQLMQVSLGKEPADLIVRGATVLNVFTLLWEPKQDIVIKGKRIAWVGPQGEWPGKCDHVLDATGKYAVPGFGESHKHIESTSLSPEYEGSLVIPFGTTWSTEGSHEFSNVNGAHNVEFWLKPRLEGSYFKIFPALGSATPPSGYESGGGYYGYKEIHDFIAQNRDVPGLDEVMDWSALIHPENPGHDRLWENIQATWDTRGVVEGHGSGLYAMDEINGFAAAGLASDHEVKLPEETFQKLEHGIFLEMRVNAIPTVVPYLVQKGIKDWSNTSVTTDDRNAADTLRLGAMNYNIKLAIDGGAPVEAAYAMGSYYTARHWHLEHLVGSIAPGRYADVVLLNDPKTVAIDRVIADGKLAAEKGKYLLPVPKIAWPTWATETIHIGRPLTAADFAIHAPAGKTEVTAAILQPRYFEPDFMTAQLAVQDGLVQADAAQQIGKVALVDRYHNDAGVSKMFWKNAGPKTPNSALACSIAHDLHNVWVIGSSDAAMAQAVNELAKMEGGWVLVNQGKVVAKVRLEIGGLMSARPAAAVAADYEHLWAEGDKMEWLGTPGLPRGMIAAFLTCTPWKWVLVAPTKEIPEGFVNVTNGQTHAVVW